MILDEILAHKRREVAERKQARPQESLRLRGTPRDFETALRAPGLKPSIIAEIKRRSPSAGELRPGTTIQAADLARTYAAAGAAALSVLTDYRYFGGEDKDLVEARAACDLPVLRKDFVVDEYQVSEARALGADAILLIVRALAPAELARLLQLTHDLGMSALVETHSANEVRIALEAGARIVGVNNRDLDTLTTDPSLALSLRDLVPPDRVFVAESGMSDPVQVDALAAAEVHAVLIGEALLRAPNPASLSLWERSASGASRVRAASGATRNPHPSPAKRRGRTRQWRVQPKDRPGGEGR